MCTENSLPMQSTMGGCVYMKMCLHLLPLGIPAPRFSLSMFSLSLSLCFPPSFPSFFLGVFKCGNLFYRSSLSAHVLLLLVPQFPIFLIHFLTFWQSFIVYRLQNNSYLTDFPAKQTSKATACAAAAHRQIAWTHYNKKRKFAKNVNHNNVNSEFIATGCCLMFLSRIFPLHCRHLL